MYHVPKIRVFDSDGVFRGGLWRPVRYPGDRQWFAPPSGPCYESLWILENGLRLRFFRMKDPAFEGSAECDDLFDRDSYAIALTPTEAMRWLEGNGYALPLSLRFAALFERPLELPVRCSEWLIGYVKAGIGKFIVLLTVGLGGAILLTMKGCAGPFDFLSRILTPKP